MRWAAALTVTNQGEGKNEMKWNYHEAWPPGEANQSWVSFFTLKDKYSVLLAHSLSQIHTKTVSFPCTSPSVLWPLLSLCLQPFLVYPVKISFSMTDRLWNSMFWEWICACSGFQNGCFHLYVCITYTNNIKTNIFVSNAEKRLVCSMFKKILN